MKILFVDDDEAILESIGSLLKSYHHTVVTCNNPIHALKLFQEMATEPFDAVITDFNMPGWSGLTLAMHIVSCCAVYGIKCPVICLTGNSSDAIRMNDQSRNPIDLILDKGCKIEDILNGIRGVVKLNKAAKA